MEDDDDEVVDDSPVVEGRLVVVVVVVVELLVFWLFPLVVLGGVLRTFIRRLVFNGLLWPAALAAATDKGVSGC